MPQKSRNKKERQEKNSTPFSIFSEKKLINKDLQNMEINHYSPINFAKIPLIPFNTGQTGVKLKNSRSYSKPGTITNLPNVVIQRQPLKDEDIQKLPSQKSEEIPDTGQGVSSAEAPPIAPPTTGKEVAEASPSGEEDQEKKTAGKDSRNEEDEEAQIVQRKPASGNPKGNSAKLSFRNIHAQLGKGTPLPHSSRSNLEASFGTNLGAVKIHNNPKANQLSGKLRAQAFTTGNHIAFASGYFQPNKPAGKWLLAHEITHVLQQKSTSTNSESTVKVGHENDVYEREANRLADQHLTPSNNKELESGPTKSKNPNYQVQGTQRPLLQLFNHSAAAAYARKWAKSTNSKYGRFGNDCTNFVSQAMYKGGWPMIGGSVFDRKRDNVWWFGKSWFTKASYTWGGAQNFANFLNARKAGTRLTNPLTLNVGDVLQIKFAGQSRIGHSMVVTKKTSADIFLSYHTTDHLDEPFSAIKSRNSGATYIPWKISDPTVPKKPKCTPKKVGPAEYLGSDCIVRVGPGPKF